MAVLDTAKEALGKIIDYGKILLSVDETSMLLRELEKGHQDARDNQFAARQRWDLVESYVGGNQVRDAQGNLHGHIWAEAESTTRSFDDEFFVVNEMLRIHQNNQQRLSSYEIRPEVSPNNLSSDVNKRGARIGRVFLADHVRRTGSEVLKKKIARILSLYGTVFGKVVFDPTRGRLIPNVETDEAGNKTFSTTNFHPEGEVVWKIISPRNILMPKWCNDLADADWIGEVHVETVDWVFRNYGATVSPENIRADDIKILSAGSLIDTKNEGQSDMYSGANLVLVKEKYVRPCPQYPKGAIFVWTAKKLLRSSELLPFYEDLPFDKAEFIYDDKSVLGDTPLWHEIPLQNARNLTMTSMSRFVKASGILPGVIIEGSNLEEKDITNGTGRFVKVGKKEDAPFYMQMPNLQETFFKFDELVQGEMQRMGASNDVARRQQALSGQAVSAMQEVDDTILKPALDSVGTMLSNMGSKTLRLAAENYDNNRMIKTTGKEGWMVQTFRGEMLDGNFDCEIKLMTGLPSNKMFRLEFLAKLQAENVLDREEVREHLEFGADEETLEEIQKDAEIADRIIEQLVDEKEYQAQTGPDGQPMTNPDGSPKMITKVVPHPWDNHQVIVKKLMMKMRESYDEWDPNVQQAAEYLLSWHQQQIAAQMTPPPPGGGAMHPDAVGQPQPPMPAGPGGPPPMGKMPPKAGLQGPTAPPGASTPLATARAIQNSQNQPPTASAPMVTGGQNLPG